MVYDGLSNYYHLFPLAIYYIPKASGSNYQKSIQWNSSDICDVPSQIRFSLRIIIIMMFMFYMGTYRSIKKKKTYWGVYPTVRHTRALANITCCRNDVAHEYHYIYIYQMFMCLGISNSPFIPISPSEQTFKEIITDMVNSSNTWLGLQLLLYTYIYI